MERFPGIGKPYLSDDNIGEDDVHHVYPTDFINSLTPSGMLPHVMTLKVGAAVMLLRNLCAGPGNSLRNGTHIIILKFRQKVLEVEIACGVNKGKCFLLPRITLQPSDTELPFTLKKRQFPIRPCFAMSTNMSWGQTLDSAGSLHARACIYTWPAVCCLQQSMHCSSTGCFCKQFWGFYKKISYTMKYSNASRGSILHYRLLPPSFYDLVFTIYSRG